MNTHIVTWQRVRLLTGGLDPFVTSRHPTILISNLAVLHSASYIQIPERNPWTRESSISPETVQRGTFGILLSSSENLHHKHATSKATTAEGGQEWRPSQGRGGSKTSCLSRAKKSNRYDGWHAIADVGQALLRVQRAVEERTREKFACAWEGYCKVSCGFRLGRQRNGEWWRGGEGREE